MRWLSLFLMAMLGIASQASAQSRSAPLQEQPASVLARARDVMGLTRIAQAVIHYHGVAAAEQNYQSDRTYPPFFSAMLIKEAWFDPRSGVERIITQTTFPGGGPPGASHVDGREASVCSRAGPVASTTQFVHAVTLPHSVDRDF